MGYLEGVDTLRLEGTRIEALGGRELCQGAEVRDYGGAAALPGLIDAHVHLTLDPEIRSAIVQARRSLDEVRSGMDARARAMLSAGITSARDLGGGAWLELELRDRIASGVIPGPRLLCAGQPLTSPGGHCHFWGGAASGPDEMRAMVRRQLEHGVDWIKLMATGGVLTQGSDTAAAQFSVDEIRAAVSEARAAGHRVAAHCHGTAGIRNASAGPVATIEHCSWLGSPGGFGVDFDPELASRIAAEGIWVSPTVNAGWRRFAEGGERGRRFLERMRACYRGLRAASVGLIASTDAGIPGVAHDRLPDALAVFALYAELTPVETLRSATSDSASALGIANRTGQLRPGLEADILIVDGDPLSDLAALLHPVEVIARGHLHEAPSSSPPASAGAS